MGENETKVSHTLQRGHNKFIVCLFPFTTVAQNPGQVKICMQVTSPKVSSQFLSEYLLETLTIQVF